jgi:hypothetical protein
MAVKFGEHSTLSLQNSDMGCTIYLLTKFIVSKKLNFCTRKFCKYILGVHKISINVAVLSELGRFPLHLNVIKSMIRYYDRLKTIEEMLPLWHATYKEHISIDDSNHAS